MIYQPYTARGVSSKPINIRRQNERLILSLVREAAVISASEISERTDLSKTTVSKILGLFCRAGITLAAGKGSSTNEGGKKPDLFQLNADYCYAITATITALPTVSCATVDLAGNILNWQHAKLPPQASYDECVRATRRLIKQALNALGEKQNRVCGIAVGSEGIMEVSSGVLLYPATPGWMPRLPLRSDLLKGLSGDHELYVENICRLSGYGELLFDENQNVDNLIVLRADDTVSGCIMVQQELVFDRRNLIGDFGHIVIGSDSPIACYCGRKGCLNSLISRTAVFRLAALIAKNYPESSLSHAAIDGKLELSALFNASNQGDIFARSVMDELVRLYSILIHNIYSLYSASKIILQGFITQAGDYFLNGLNQNVRHFNRFDIYDDLEICYSRFNANEGDEEHDPFYRGAAYYLTNHYLEKKVIKNRSSLG